MQDWCGKLRRDVKCGDEECGICNVLCGVRCGKWCNVLLCQMWWCDVKSRCGCVMWCGIWCGVKCAVMLNSCEMWTVAAWCAICCALWWCEMVVGGRLRCNVRCRIWWSEVRCVATLNVRHWDTAWNMWYVVMWCGMSCNGDVMWNGVMWSGVVWNGATWKVVWCKIFWCYVMEWCVTWKRLMWCGVE